MNRRKFGKRFGLVTGLLLMAGLGVFWFWGAPFNGSVWKDEARVREGVRLKMADRLLIRRTLKGKTRSEIVKLLGEPSKEGYFRGWDLVYYLGPERSFFSIDSEWLVLRLNPMGCVSEAKIVRD